MINKEIKILLKKAQKTNILETRNETITQEVWNKIIELTNLQKLDFSRESILDNLVDGITEIPKEIVKLTNLQELIIDRNRIEKIPKEIGKLTNLQTLSFSHNQIKEIPKEIEKLTNIQKLYFSDNQIKELPKQIGKLTNLQELNFFYNQITVLPKEIGKLTYLQDLNFSGNEIKEVPKEIGKLTNLQILNFSDNLIKELPKEIGKLTNLQILNFSGNQIKELPKEIGKLTNLQKLSFWNNQIKELPNVIGKLTNLQELSFLFNQIKELPKEIEELTNLQELSLSFNQMKELPKEIGKLTNLQELNFSNTTLSIPKNFELINFKLFENFKLQNLSEEINLIIGKNGTGKTSILQAITFALVNEENEDINIKLNRFIRKKSEKTEKPALHSKFLHKEIDNKQNETIIKTIYSNEIIKKIIISNRINENGLIIKNDNLLLSYGSNLFHKINIFNSQIIDNLVSGYTVPYSIFSIFEPFTDKFIDPAQTLLQLEVKCENNKEVKEVFDILLEKLNEFLEIQEIEQFKIVRGTGGYFYENQLSKQKFSLSELSEGYRSNILLVSDILIRILMARNYFSDSVSDIFKNVVGTILIDEFDKHLHPTWQRLFVSKLRKILPNIQFFLTTQNPVSFQSVEGYTAVILSKDKNGNPVAKIEKIKYGNSLEVINNYYFEGEIYGKQTSKDINELNELKKTVLIKKTRPAFDNFIQKTKEIKQKNIIEEFSTLIDYDVSYLQNFIENVKNK